MASLRWDRLLETCYRRNASDLLLTPGSPPVIRLAESWRTLEAPAVAAPDIEAVVKERLSATPDGQADGYAYWIFFHGDKGRWRAMAFGYPSTTLLLIARQPTQGSDSPPQRAGV